MSEIKRPLLLKPTLDTPFRIDFAWWAQNENDWHVHLRSMLCESHQQMFESWDNSQTIDWVDPETAEVHQLDGLQHTLMSHCAKEPGFLTDHTAMVDAVFRSLLSNGNIPMSSKDLSVHLGKPAEVILKTISGPRIYKGIRPLYS